MSELTTPSLNNEGDLELACQGDADAITRLFEKYHPLIYRYLYYRTNDPHIADDLTSEVFLRMVRHLPKYQPRAGKPFKAWLFQIARNAAIDHYRAQAKVKETRLTETLMSPGPTLEALTEQALTTNRLAEALSTLGQDQRDVLIMRFIMAEDINTVSQVLNKTEDAIKGLQRRGLASLREQLGE